MEKNNFPVAYDFYIKYLSDIHIDLSLLSHKKLLYSYWVCFRLEPFHIENFKPSTLWVRCQIYLLNVYFRTLVVTVWQHHTAWEGKYLFWGHASIVTVKRESWCLLSCKLHISVDLTFIRETWTCINMLFLSKNFSVSENDFWNDSEALISFKIRLQMVSWVICSWSTYPSRNALQQFLLSLIPKFYQKLMISSWFQRSMSGGVLWAQATGGWWIYSWWGFMF